MTARIAAAVFLCLAFAGCKGTGGKENEELRAKVQELTAKVSSLEADTGRLKEQIRLLTAAADSLSGAMKVQQSLGSPPAPTSPQTH